MKLVEAGIRMALAFRDTSSPILSGSSFSDADTPSSPKDSSSESSKLSQAEGGAPLKAVGDQTVSSASSNITADMPSEYEDSDMSLSSLDDDECKAPGNT